MSALAHLQNDSSFCLGMMTIDWEELKRGDPQQQIAAGRNQVHTETAQCVLTDLQKRT